MICWEKILFTHIIGKGLVFLMFKDVQKNYLKEGDRAIGVIKQNKNNQFIEVILMTKPVKRCQISIVIIEMKW